MTASLAVARAARAAPANELAPWRGAHAGETIVVCGCGASLRELHSPERFVTIGVNDVGRLFDPTYLVVVNPRNQFRGDRFRHVEQSNARRLFTQLDLGPVRPPVVRFRLGRREGTDIGEDAVLHYTQNSPYVAVCLAALMGARRIGLVGVDFTDHHFFAATGTHSLASRLGQIDREYGALAQALAARGVELVNLSGSSRLQSLPRVRLEAFEGETRPVVVAAPVAAAPVAAGAAPRRVFVVDYRFQSCGDVFGVGLGHAAQALGLACEQGPWDEPQLLQRIERFRPDLVLVVHGRRFAQRWRGGSGPWRTAVWLVDEPYEVDDTVAWSGLFDHVFVNDPATLARHRNAHALPMCFDPAVHHDAGRARIHPVGFIGGANPTRERFLLGLAEAGLLGYVVGGPWQSPVLRRLALAPVVSPAQAAQLYQQTEIVLNVFRDRHHFNARGTPGTAMNPRIYEALACGALVLSERRPEIGSVFPELPQFDTPDELVALARALLADGAQLERLRRACRERLQGHAYSDRLAQALAIALDAPHIAPCPPALPLRRPVAATPVASNTPLAASAPRAHEPLALQPLAATPRRHLLFHVWPVRGETWRWNVAQLLRRIDLFNGRRLVGIVTDERSEPADAVRAAFAGHGCEFVEMPNDSRGEAATFPALLQRLAGTDPQDVSFYAHAKGVKYEPAFPPAVRRWAEVQYAVALDHWPAVREQLDRWAMTGMLRRLGRFANHRNLGDWHYSGTFFWFRHGPVFRRAWQDVPQFYGGVEAWPGVMFSRHETGCLLLDNLRDLPYLERFWTQRGNPALEQWKKSRRPVPVPPGLARPAPFEGHEGPRLEQLAGEFAWWLDQLLASDARRLLVIGAPHGGIEWHVARRFAEAGRAIAIASLVPGAAPAFDAALGDARERFGADVTRIDADSATPGIAERLGAPFDAAFIDGEHGYRACRRDVDLAFALGARQVALHDIVDSEWHAASLCATSRVWDELRAAGPTEERRGADWGGIGIAHRAVDRS